MTKDALVMHSPWGVFSRTIFHIFYISLLDILLCPGERRMKILVNMVGIGLAIFILVPFICCVGLPPRVEAQSTAEISVEPEKSTVQIETEINMSIMVSNILDLCSWQVYIYFLNKT